MLSRLKKVCGEHPLFVILLAVVKIFDTRTLFRPAMYSAYTEYNVQYMRRMHDCTLLLKIGVRKYVEKMFPE